MNRALESLGIAVVSALVVGFVFVTFSGSPDTVIGGNTGGSGNASGLSQGLSVNESGNDNDSRIQGDTDADLFFVNAGTDRVGISTNAPSYALDVAGTFGASGAATLSTTTTGSLTVGGDACTLTDADGGAVSLTQELLNRCSYITMAGGGAGQEVIQLTPVATSSLTTFIPTAGQCKSIMYDASALAAGTTTTHTATAGHILVAPSTADDVIDGGEYSKMTFCRRPDTDITWSLDDEEVDAD